MKIVVTGAAGRLGTHVCRQLAAAGHEVTGADLMFRRDLGVPLKIVNLLDREACYGMIEGAQAVVHLGNHSTPYHRLAQALFSENAAMNMNVFQAAQELGVARIIFASSVQVQAGERQAGPGDAGSRLAWLPVDGTAPAIPGNAYALSKHAGEIMLHYFSAQFGLSTVAVRFPMLVNGLLANPPGAWDRYGRLDEVFAGLTFADAARLVVAGIAADLPGFRVYFPASPDPISTRPVVELVRDHYPRVPLRVPLAGLTSLVDVSAITRETGWAPSRLRG